MMKRLMPIAAAAALLSACEPAIEGLRRAYEVGRLPLLRLPESTADIDSLKPVAARHRALCRRGIAL